MDRGAFVKTGIFSGVLFGVAMGAYYLVIGEAELWVALALGVGSGLFFGLAMGLVLAWMARRLTAKRPVLPGETVIREGLANHRKGIEACGGWLFLTRDRLHFKTHRFNLQNHELDIPLREVAGAEAGRTLGLIPNRLIVTLTNGVRESFIVQGAKAWQKAIAAATRQPA